MGTTTKNSAKESEPLPTREAFDALVQAANTGDRVATEKLAKMLDQHPDLWNKVGDLARHAELLLVLKIAAGDQFTQQSIERHTQQMREELLGPNPSPMERLLVDNFLVAWLHLQHLNIRYPITSDMDIPAGRYILQQRESAQRMLNAAQQAIHVYRKFAPPKLKLKRKEGTVPFSPVGTGRERADGTSSGRAGS